MTGTFKTRRGMMAHKQGQGYSFTHRDNSTVIYLGSQGSESISLAGHHGRDVLDPIMQKYPSGSGCRRKNLLAAFQEAGLR